MNQSALMKPEFIPVLTKDEIQKRVAVLGARISSDYQNRDLLFVGVLKGAFIFLADLVRHVDIPAAIDFIQVSSYGSGTCTSGNVQLDKPLGTDVRNKDVLIVEDIIDTGLTLTYLIEHMKSLHARTVKVCTLIDKKERRETDVPIDYAGQVVESGFLVGYGLDCDEKYRGLPGIYHLKF